MYNQRDSKKVDYNVGKLSGNIELWTVEGIWLDKRANEGPLISFICTQVV